MTFAHFVKLIVIDIVYFSETCHIKHHWFNTDVVLNYYNIVFLCESKYNIGILMAEEIQSDRWRVLIQCLHVYEFRCTPQGEFSRTNYYEQIGR